MRTGLILNRIESNQIKSNQIKSTHNSLDEYTGSAPNNPNGRSNFGGQTSTCQQVFERGVIPLPPENCTFVQTIGVSICYCGVELPQDNNNCTLCEDGSSLPQGSLESFPSQTCAALQNDAKRETDFASCIIYQAVVGHYCGCDNPNAIQQKACRICGHGVDLPVPQKMVGSSSCIELEFDASSSSNNGTTTACADVPSSYVDACCEGATTPAPTPASSSASRLIVAGIIMAGAWFSVVLML